MFYMNVSREIALLENLVIVHITLLVVGHHPAILPTAGTVA